MNKNNLFILDIDNVLNTNEHIQQVNEQAGIEDRDEFLDYFHENPGEYLQRERVKRLSDCLDDLDPDPYIVLCSSWQTMGVQTVQDVLEENGFSHPIQDRTFDIYGGGIMSVRFMVLLGTVRKIDPDRLVILDDDEHHDSFGSHHVSPEDGLEEDYVESVKEVWTVDYVPNDSPPAKVPKSMRDDNDDAPDERTSDHTDGEDPSITIGEEEIEP